MNNDPRVKSPHGGAARKKIPFHFVPVPREVFDDPLPPAQLALLAYICRHQVSFGNENVRLSDGEILHGRRKAGGERMDGGCGFKSRNTLREARAKLARTGWIEVTEDATDKARLRRYYRVSKIDTVPKSDTQVAENDTRVSNNDARVSKIDTRTHSRDSGRGLEEKKKGETAPPDQENPIRNGTGDGKAAGEPPGTSPVRGEAQSEGQENPVGCQKSTPNHLPFAEPPFPTPEEAARLLVTREGWKPAPWDLDAAKEILKALTDRFVDCDREHIIDCIKCWRHTWTRKHQNLEPRKVEQLLSVETIVMGGNGLPHFYEEYSGRRKRLDARIASCFPPGADPDALAGGPTQEAIRAHGHSNVFRWIERYRRDVRQAVDRRMAAFFPPEAGAGAVDGLVKEAARAYGEVAVDVWLSRNRREVFKAWNDSRALTAPASPPAASSSRPERTPRP